MAVRRGWTSANAGAARLPLNPPQQAQSRVGTHVHRHPLSSHLTYSTTTVL